MGTHHRVTNADNKNSGGEDLHKARGWEEYTQLYNSTPCNRLHDPSNEHDPSPGRPLGGASAVTGDEARQEQPSFSPLAHKNNTAAKPRGRDAR